MQFKILSPARFVCFAVVVFSGCMDGSGLDIGGDAAGGTTTGGQGGVTSTGGLSGTGCGPVCTIACQFGNVLDAKGCATCSCNPAPVECSLKECSGLAAPALARLCPDGSAVGFSCKRSSNGQCAVIEDQCPAMCKPVTCKLGCPNGFKKDAQGCELCECTTAPQCKADECGLVPPVAPCPGGNGPQITCERGRTGECGWNVGQCPMVCPAVACNLFCEFGNQSDTKGCPICACKPAPVCSKADCGPGPLLPSRICDDGSTAGPTCGRLGGGKCGWEITACPAACSDARELKTCELNPLCQWLEPGCTGNKLPVAGCFARKSVGCDTNKDCPAGKQCASRTVDHCAKRPAMLCITCASPVNVCL